MAPWHRLVLPVPGVVQDAKLWLGYQYAVGERIRHVPAQHAIAISNVVNITQKDWVRLGLVRDYLAARLLPNTQPVKVTTIKEEDMNEDLGLHLYKH